MFSVTFSFIFFVRFHSRFRFLRGRGFVFGSNLNIPIFIFDFTFQVHFRFRFRSRSHRYIVAISPSFSVFCIRDCGRVLSSIAIFVSRFRPIRRKLDGQNRPHDAGQSSTYQAPLFP